jgi:hypothetical protein
MKTPDYIKKANKNLYEKKKEQGLKKVGFWITEEEKIAIYDLLERLRDHTDILTKEERDYFKAPN